jgi:lipoate-protein ligase A
MPDKHKGDFRVLDSPPLSGAEHMALDEIIVKAHSENLIPNTLRFLQFKPCALVGLHQNVRLEVNVPYCRAHGIDINRRITGGGSLYFGPMELGWEMYAAKDTPGIPRRVEDLYRVLCEGMVCGLKKIGIDAAYRPINDIEAGGRKISGTGGTELHRSFVFQSTLIVNFDVAEMLNILNIPLAKIRDKAVRSMRERVTSVYEQLGRIPSHDRMKEAIVAGLSETLNYHFTAGALTGLEKTMLHQRLPFFQSDAWIYGSDGHISDTMDSVADFKAPGGLIRIQMRLDDAARIIKYVIITGDFFAYPARIVNDLETALKNTPADGGTIARVVGRFFEQVRAEIPGVTPGHVITALLLAVDRAKTAQSRDLRQTGSEI